MSSSCQCPLCGNAIDSPPLIPRQKSKSSIAFGCSQMGHHHHDDIYWCDLCQVGFIWPMPSEKKVQAAYEQVEDVRYLEERPARMKTFEHAMNVLKPYAASGRLLEVGSYCGFFLQLADEAGFEVLGVEPSAWACRYANTQLQMPTLQGSFEQEVTQKALQQKVPVDVIVAWDVLEHVVQPKRFLEHVHACLEPEGIFAFSTLDIHNWWARLLGKRWPWYMQTHLYYFTMSGLEQLLEETGFELLHHEPYQHVVSGKYLSYKTQQLLPWAPKVPGFLERKLSNTYVPFRLGDIPLIIAQKTMSD